MAAPAGASEALDPNTPQEPHPKGLYILFMTEMWERFSYYGMRALLVGYMTSAAFGYRASQANGVYKWYTSLVYLTPLLGGLLADRFLGLRSAVLMGAVLMAIGHILMAFPSHTVFFAALAFLIVGNGLFKPNISTMLGRMYGPKDGRRDRAFTIFYMGINLGAGIAGIACGNLRQSYGCEYGFAAAGVGMMIGLIVFAVGNRRVAKDVEAAGNSVGTAKDQAAKAALRAAEIEAARPADEKPAENDADLPGSTGIAGILSKVYPAIMVLGAFGILAFYGVKVAHGEEKPTALIMPVAFGAVFVAMATVLVKLRNREKDKSVSVFIMFLFPVLFWMAFEQAGTALNFWANDHTNLKIFGWEYPAEYWQSANSVFIVALAPVFTIVWSFLAKRKQEPSTPAKMAIALFFIITAFGAMVVGAASENGISTEVAYTPRTGTTIDAKNLSSFDAGRLSFADGKLSARGVLASYAVRNILEKTAPEDFQKGMKALEDKSNDASKDAPAVGHLKIPAWFDITVDDGLKDLKLVTTTTDKLDVCAVKVPAAELTKATKVLCGPEVVLAWGVDELVIVSPGELKAQAKTRAYSAVSEPEWRTSLNELEKESHRARVSAWWLFLAYLLMTIGELCLSPVGLSMVTKLAPARLAGLFMGVWLLSSSVAQYAGGTIGELWGEIPPQKYFMIFIATSVFGALLSGALVKPLKTLMHNVK